MRTTQFARLRSAAVVVGVLILVSWITIPRLPPGICFDDSGDLQLASASLGIAHPPGYPGYASIGFLLTRIFPADPAYVVSVACFVAGLCALTASMLLQVHLGVSVWCAAATSIGLVAHPRFWTNLRAPEVYMPTLALLGLSAVLLVQYAKSGLRRYLAIAVFLFGIALGNRPPVLFAVPFFLIAWYFANRSLGTTVKSPWKALSWMIPLAAAPTLYSFAYLYVRDQPDICYNYIELHNEKHHVVPPFTDGVRAKCRRVAWQISAEQFRHYMGADWRILVGKARWLRTQVAYGQPFTDLAVFGLTFLGFAPPDSEIFSNLDVYVLLALVVCGLVIAFRRSRVAAWLLTGLIVSCVIFVLAYQVFGQAADLLPLLLAGTVAIGVAASKLFPANGHWGRQAVACVIAVVAAVLFVNDIPTKSMNSTGVDATQYLDTLDLSTFPGPAVICANWTKSVPMRYGQCVLSPRSDLHIVTSGPEFWMNVVERENDRPVYGADPFDSGGICEVSPFRNVFLLDCPKHAAASGKLP